MMSIKFGVTFDRKIHVLLFYSKNENSRCQDKITKKFQNTIQFVLSFLRALKKRNALKAFNNRHESVR